MDLGYQRTGGIHHPQIAELAGFSHRRRDTVGAINEPLAVRNFVHLIDKDGTLSFQFLNDIAVMHDLLADVDGWAKCVQGNADDIDGTNHPGTKATGLEQKQSLRLRCCHCWYDYTLSASKINLSLIS